MENSNIITFKLNVTELDELSDIIKSFIFTVRPCSITILSPQYNYIYF